MEILTCEEFKRRSDLLDFPEVKIIKISNMPNETQLLDIIGKYSFDYSNGTGNTIFIIGKINLRELFDKMHNYNTYEYIWGDLFEHESEEEIKKIIPLIESSRETESFKLYVGNQNTGSHIHYHPPAANFLLYGSKLWWIFPKTDKNKEVVTYLGYSKNMPIKKNVRQWIKDNGDYIKENVEGLVIKRQYAGEVLIIPNDFYHLIINTSPCIGVVHSWENSYETYL